MSKIFITSDWHFMHNKDFLYAPRGFASVEEMNEAIVERHNSIVSPNDTVYCLGDCGLDGGDPSKRATLKTLIERLNGNIIIIRGNHDTNSKVELYESCKNVVKVIGYADEIKYRKYNFYLSHYPTLTANFDDGDHLKRIKLNLYGHTHQRNNFYEDSCFMYHVGMDSHDCYPVLLDDIVEEIKEKFKDKKCNESSDCL